MYNTLFMGWNAPKNGRERQAGELFGAVQGYFESEKRKGTIQSFEPVLLAVHGGDMNGFFIIKGEHAKLAQMRESEEFMKIVMQAGYCLDDFGVIAAYHGDALADLMGKWTEMVGATS